MADVAGMLEGLAMSVPGWSMGDTRMAAGSMPWAIRRALKDDWEEKEAEIQNQSERAHFCRVSVTLDTDRVG